MDTEANKTKKGLSNKTELWAQLLEIQQQEMDEVDAERTKLEEEKTAMTKIKADPSDIISINAGGQIFIQAHRDTLCVAEGSTFSNMFTGRWEDSCARDEEGRVFLDHDPEMILWIVNFLRRKKIENPSKPFRPPMVPKEKKEDFMCLLEYFGLEDIVYPSPVFPWDLQPLPSSSSRIAVSSVGKDKHRVTHNGSGHQAVAFSPALEGHQSFYWKCTITSLSSGGWLYLGVISNRNLSQSSYSDSTSYGWACSSQRYVAGRNTPGDGWTGFVQGEVLYFQLQDQTLTMYSTVKNQSFSMSKVANSCYVHFNLHASGTMIELEPSLSLAEKSAAGW